MHFFSSHCSECSAVSFSGSTQALLWSNGSKHLGVLVVCHLLYPRQLRLHWHVHSVGSRLGITSTTSDCESWLQALLTHTFENVSGSRANTMAERKQTSWGELASGCVRREKAFVACESTALTLSWQIRVQEWAKEKISVCRTYFFHLDPSLYRDNLRQNYIFFSFKAEV